MQHSRYIPSIVADRSRYDPLQACQLLQFDNQLDSARSPRAVYVVVHSIELVRLILNQRDCRRRCTSHEHANREWTKAECVWSLYCSRRGTCLVRTERPREVGILLLRCGDLCRSAMMGRLCFVRYKCRSWRPIGRTIASVELALRFRWGEDAAPSVVRIVLGS